MLRGFAGVVGPGLIQPGRFYIESVGERTALFLRIEGPSIAAVGTCDLHFDPKDGHGLWLREPSGFGPVTELPDLHVRVDPRSARGNRRNTIPGPGMLFVSGSDVFVTGGWKGTSGMLAVNLSTGVAEQPQPPGDWLIYSRWSLVMDDRDTETTMVRFGHA